MPTDSMTVSIKLGSALNDYRPAQETSQTFTLERPAGNTVSDIIVSLNIPDEQMLLVLVNGSIVPKKQRSATILADQDQVSIMPPLYAG